MKKTLGAVVALYPTPVTIVGTMAGDRVNWINIAHIGIIGHDSILLSMNKTHYTNQWLKKNKTASVNLVSEEMLIEADYVGLTSGKTTDKSAVFSYHMGALNTPVIDKSPLVMECEVADIYNSESHDNFILRVVHTHVEEAMLGSDGKIDYEKLRPILFEMPTRSYLKTGEVIAKCWDVGRKYQSK